MDDDEQPSPDAPPAPAQARQQRVLRVFLSSTKADLAPYRDAAALAVQRLGMLPVRMETFGAKAERSVPACLHEVETCDALVVVVARRYGWVPTAAEGGDGTRSITRLEVDRALELGKPVLGFVLDEATPWSGPTEEARLRDPAVRADPTKLADVARKLDGLDDLRTRLRQRPCEFFSTKDDLAARVTASLSWLAGAPRTTAPDPLVAYRSWLVRSHSDLVPFFGDTGRPIEDVLVQVGIERVAKEHAGSGPLTLRQLLELGPHDRTTGRWVLRGAPGAGKSTLCRELAHCLGGEADGPIPVLVPLVTWASEPDGSDPFTLVAREACGVEDQPRLVEALRALATDEQGRLWILLDGLDEVWRARGVVEARILTLARTYPHARILVATRPEAYEPDRFPGFREAKLLDLRPDEQQRLLRGWLGQELAKEAESLIAARPRIAELASNPLTLTLIAKLVELARRPELGSELWGLPRDLPLNRTGLYERAVHVLLRRGHGRLLRKGVRDARAAERLLAPLALRLLLSEKESWTPQELIDDVWALIGRDDELAGFVKLTWDGSPQAFIDDLGQNAGILGLHDGPGTTWRFLHRSLRDYLAAKAIADGRLTKDVEGVEDEAAWLVDRLRGNDETGRWGEVVALLCGQLRREDPRRGKLLDVLVSSDHELATRTLPTLEGLEIGEALRLLRQIPEDGYWQRWDGEDLRRLLASLLLDNHAAEDIRRAVMADVSADLSTDDLAYRYYALERSGVGIDRAYFFRACGRWPERGHPEPPAAVRIPRRGSSVRFTMGSPEVEKGRWKLEGPLHEVQLSPFRLGVTPVTEAQYAVFESGLQVTQANRPVVNVSWWAAWLYARWVGGDLPTEAQWECACRAGTTTRFWFGNSSRMIRQVVWYGGVSGGYVHPVGEKQANPFGLYDMHGLVYEWCADWFGPYTEQAERDPSGPPAGIVRIIRGGSYDSGVWRCRSVYRHVRRPAHSRDNQGFRVALPAEP